MRRTTPTERLARAFRRFDTAALNLGVGMGTGEKDNGNTDEYTAARSLLCKMIGILP